MRYVVPEPHQCGKGTTPAAISVNGRAEGARPTRAFVEMGYGTELAFLLGRRF